MRRAVRTTSKVILLAVLPLLGGCPALATSGYFVLQTAQMVLQNHVFKAKGEFEGEFTANSTFLAVNAKVDAELTYTAPDPETGVIRVVWTKKISKESGQRAYRVIFGKDNKFVGVAAVPWEVAMASLEARSAVPVAEAG